MAVSKPDAENRLGSAEEQPTSNEHHERSHVPKSTYLLLRVKSIGLAMLTGFGFMCDAYDLFIINLVLAVMKYLYPQTSSDAALVSACVVIGAVLGQLSFGAIGDRIGRRPALITTFCLLVFGSVCSAVLSWPWPGIGVYGCMMLWRFILGFGVGGEYPLSATAASEQSSKAHHVAMTFSMQGVGNLLAPITILVLLKVIPDDKLDAVWRLGLGLAAIYVLPALVIRLRMHSNFKPQPANAYFQTIKSNWKPLLGASSTWLLFDIVFYANGLFSSTLISMMHLDSGETPNEKLSSLATFSIYLGLMALPGYWAGSAAIDRLGIKRLQIIGFVALIVLYAVMGFAWAPLLQYPGLFIFLYGLSFFTANFGPNTTTFVMPAHIFPPQVRATCSGIAAASGKVGAVIGAYSMKPLLDIVGPGWTLVACAGVAVSGLIMTILLVPADVKVHDNDGEVEMGDRVKLMLLEPQADAMAGVSFDALPRVNYSPAVDQEDQ